MAVTHPRIDADVYEALMATSGWSAPIEYLGGEVVVVPPSGGWAGYAQNAIAAQLHTWQQQAGDRGLVLLDTFIRFGSETVAPDASYWVASRRPHVVRGRIDGPAPDLVVEVLSPETAANDTGPKRSLYLGAQVREYWIVDPAGRQVTLARPDEDDTVLRGGDRLASIVLAAFDVSVGDLFAPT